MDYTTLAGTAVQKGFGNIVKAQLIFYEPVAIIKKIKIGAVNDKKVFTGETNDFEMGNVITSGAGNGVDAQNRLATAIESTQNNLEEGKGMQVSGTRLDYGDHSKKKILEVQFNPATLRLTARGGGRNLVSNAINDGTNEQEEKKDNNHRDAFSYQRLNPFVDISFRLTFDQEINSDAFMRDKLTLNLTNAAKTIGSLVTGQEYTVQPIVEGFIGAVRSSYHRMMAISWGPMEYSGMLNSVSSRYTMFSPSGNPIRAEVDMNLYCANMDDNFNNWEKKYERAVSGAKEDRNRAMRDNNDYEQFNNDTSILSNFLNL